MKKIKFITISIWLSLVSMASPIWTGGIYMSITGHGKGYGYDLGAETDISIFLGVILLALWVAALIPAMIWICKKCYSLKKSYILIPLIGFIIFFTVGVLFLGLNEFMKLFGLA